MSSGVEHASSVWPEGQEYLKPLVCTGYLLVVALMSILFTRRLGTSQLRRLPFMQLLVISLLGGSLLFVFISAIMILGVGSSFSDAACNTGIWLCILLYAATKAVLYVLLLEKLHAVYGQNATARISRLQSWYYRGGCVLFFAWIAVAGTMIAGRVGLLREHDGACVIGLKLWATVPILAVDAVTNIYLTTLFIIPIWRSNFPKAQRLARRSAVAAVAALLTSFANILVLTLEHGHQLSWVCLGSCGLDVCFNSIIVYLVTSSTSKDGETTSSHSRSTPKNQSNRKLSPFFPSSEGFDSTRSGDVGVTIVEEVRVDTHNHDLEMQPQSPRQSYPHATAVSFEVPMQDVDGKDEVAVLPRLDRQ
ncbi:hypothetical protein JCM10213_008577 [Rhodosporidiobolus nylandii]